jgi:hypothetical protein
MKTSYYWQHIFPWQQLVSPTSRHLRLWEWSWVANSCPSVEFMFQVAYYIALPDYLHTCFFETAAILWSRKKSTIFTGGLNSILSLDGRWKMSGDWVGLAVWVVICEILWLLGANNLLLFTGPNSLSRLGGTSSHQWKRYFNQLFLHNLSFWGKKNEVYAFARGVLATAKEDRNFTSKSSKHHSC